MMLAYYSVIKDSFREALASRILPIVLGMTTLVLIALAGFGIHETAGSSIQRHDVLDTRALMEELRTRADDEAPSPGKRIWESLPQKTRESLSKDAAGDTSPVANARRLEQFRDALNEAVRNRELYDAPAWQALTLPDEAKRLIERGPAKLKPEEVARLNRLLIEAAYPKYIAPNRDVNVGLSYFAYQLTDDLGMRKKDVISTSMTVFMEWFVGLLGVLVAVLVTANIMPQTFEAGAIDLLLSKPISRGGLYVAKFLGGCMFTLLSAGYVIVGLWLIAGLRHGMWSNKLLLCIPIFMFLFSVLYAVSSLAGALWRNAIVCVVITLLFWGFCFSLGVLKSSVELLALNPHRLVSVKHVDGDWLSVTESGQFQKWSSAADTWTKLFDGAEDAANVPPFAPRLPAIGPELLPASKELVAIVPPIQGRGFAGANSLVVAKAPEFGRQRGISAPPGTVALFVDSSGRLLAAGSTGLYRLEGQAAAGEKEVKILGFQVPDPNAKGNFKQLEPELRFMTSVSAAREPVSGKIAFYDGRKLAVLEPADSDYSLAQQIEIDDAQPGQVGFMGGQIVLGLRGGKIEVRDSQKLEVIAEYRPEGNVDPRFVRVSPDGRFAAVLFHNSRLWLYDAQSRKPFESSVASQGRISAVAFPDAGHMVLGVNRTSIRILDLPNLNVAETLRPSRTTWERAYDWLIEPSHTVLPKPGELSNAVHYLLSDRGSVELQPGTGLQSQQVALDIWTPIWSNLAFVAVMVALGALYTQWKDF